MLQQGFHPATDILSSSGDLLVGEDLCPEVTNEPLHVKGAVAEFRADWKFYRDARKQRCYISIDFMCILNCGTGTLKSVSLYYMLYMGLFVGLGVDGPSMWLQSRG